MFRRDIPKRIVAREPINTAANPKANRLVTDIEEKKENI
jgi:hypothetical protein